MQTLRFGELLGRVVNLSRHDVDEILADQSASHRRFGDIALSWGLCQPQDVWQAWCDQLGTQIQQVDLEMLGIDAQAAGTIDSEVARRLGVVPIRCIGNHLIVAMADGNTQRVAAELSLITHKSLRFVIADSHQIQLALAVYYPTEPKAA